MFYFLINASICHFSFESHIVWNIDDNIFQKWNERKISADRKFSQNIIVKISANHILQNFFSAEIFRCIIKTISKKNGLELLELFCLNKLRSV
jgi:hypothetical protein